MSKGHDFTIPGIVGLMFALHCEGCSTVNEFVRREYGQNGIIVYTFDVKMPPGVGRKIRFYAWTQHGKLIEVSYEDQHGARGSAFDRQYHTTYIDLDCLDYVTVRMLTLD